MSRNESATVGYSERGEGRGDGVKSGSLRYDLSRASRPLLGSLFSPIRFVSSLSRAQTQRVSGVCEGCIEVLINGDGLGILLTFS